MHALVPSSLLMRAYKSFDMTANLHVHAGMSSVPRYLGSYVLSISLKAWKLVPCCSLYDPLPDPHSLICSKNPNMNDLCEAVTLARLLDRSSHQVECAPAKLQRD